MRFRNSLLLLLAVQAAVQPAKPGTFAVLGSRTGAWPLILSSVGHVSASPASADILVAPVNAPASPDYQARVRSGAALILEGASPLAESFGFRGSLQTIPVVHLIDVHNPALPIIWAKPAQLPVFDVSGEARVFAEERWSKAPLIAGYRIGAGAVLWVAAGPGPSGYERFPYLMQALADLGFAPTVRASRLWAFFDYSYRTRADADYLAARWRLAGIGALHVASWHFYDPDPARDKYLEQLIAACHRHGVLVYAWVELPHVSEKFWTEHPQWREKTALGQDAQLDWRKLMNLQNPESAAAVRNGLERLLHSFDWDGVNLAELYFESLEGAANPARFTPMNAEVREAFRSEAGWDPAEIWSKRNDAASLRRFLDFRASLARRMQEDWLQAVEKIGPGLDVVLTHVDDRFDVGMRDAIGADAGRVLPLLDSHRFSFLIEDPATVWNLGPQRYTEIAKRYQPLTPHQDRLAIDINIVDRYQDVYPTKQQTGAELFELVHMASGAFARVALYFENSILPPDLPLLASASATVTKLNREKRRLEIESPSGVEVAWNEPGALVDGKPWPIEGPRTLRLPAGAHTIDPAPRRPAIAVLDLNARLESASAEGRRALFTYQSESRALARFDRKPSHLEIDGAETPVSCLEDTACTLLLPRGAHRIAVE
jgi:hypothetical protein